MGKDYRKSLAWQKSDAFAMAAYQATRRFPREERYGLTSQLRRAALSAPTNIVEGSGRQTQRDYLVFLNRAETSLEEAAYLIGFAKRLGYLEAKDSEGLLVLQDEAARILRGLIARIRRDLKETT